jgi:LacI family transcriptional regulator
MATLNDIAKRANTSITTVSRVLNHDETLRVSDELRAQIIEIARALDYKPRRRRAVLTSPTYHIGILMWYDTTEEQHDPYYLQIRLGIEQEARRRDIRTTLVYKHEDRFDLKSLQGVDGLVCVGKFAPQEIRSFAHISKHLVFVDSSPEEESFDSVVIDFHSAVKEMLGHMLDSGYKTIGYLGGEETISKHIKLGERRELVFRDFLFQRNRLQTKYIHVGQFSVESGYELMKDALRNQDHAEAYFCANDNIAFGALRAIHEAGLRVPEDIAIAGFNDDANSAFTFPPLTTIRVHTRFMGEEALRSLIERLQGRTLPIKKIIPTKLVKRNSL